jgi:hypothetical protein
VLAPLRLRDFRLLWTARTVSLLGDGVYVVAIARQAYQTSDSPFALAVTGVAWTLPVGRRAAVQRCTVRPARPPAET